MNLTREYLIERYIERNMTSREIAQEAGVSSSTVMRAIHHYGIKPKLQAPRSAKGERNANWRGGRHIRSGKYRMIHMPDHPQAQSDGYVAEHILVALNANGRERLTQDECVHHINFDKLDNRPDNLYICTRTQHTEYHARLEQLTAQLLHAGIVIFDPERGYRLKAG